MSNKINLSEYKLFLKQKEKFESIVSSYFKENHEGSIDHIDFKDSVVIVYNNFNDLEQFEVEIDILKLTGKT